MRLFEDPISRVFWRTLYHASFQGPYITRPFETQQDKNVINEKEGEKRRGGIRKLNGRWDFKNIFVIARTLTVDRLKVLIGQQQQINETVLKKGLLPSPAIPWQSSRTVCTRETQQAFHLLKKTHENVFLLIGTKPCDNAAVPGIGWVENISMEIN